MNNPSASRRASSARGVVLRQTCLGRGQTSFRLLLGRSRLVQTSCQAPLRRSSAARPARDRESPGRARSVLPRAPVEAAEGRLAPRAAAAGGRVPAREIRSRQAPLRRRRVSRPSMGATTSAAPPGRASRRAGTRIDSRTACSFTRAVPKSRLHCCSFRKLMPGASSPAAGAAHGPRRRSDARRLRQHDVHRSVRSP